MLHMFFKEKLMKNTKKNVICIETTLVKKYEIRLNKTEYVLITLQDTDGVITINYGTDKNGLAVYEKSKDGKFNVYRRTLDEIQFEALSQYVFDEYLKKER